MNDNWNYSAAQVYFIVLFRYIYNSLLPAANTTQMMLNAEKTFVFDTNTHKRKTT